ncbi:MAG: amidohydrolase family protein [Bryobacteraceae bacterium]|nr:amidohydrolase family protein [Bryobacteraceae bacterium]
MDITDAYAHCGLRKYKPYQELDRLMRAAGVKRAVLVQHHGEFDNSYLEAIVRREPARFRGVYLVDTDARDAMDEITRWAGRGWFRGIRFRADTLPKRRSLWDWAATLGLHIVADRPVDGVAEELSQFAADHPRNSLVITHMAWAGGSEAALALAARPNVFVQVSAMHSYGSMPYVELRPWIDRLYSAFGRTRLLYGSNYPVMGEDVVYQQEIKLLREGRLGVPAADAAAVMDENARRVWFEGMPGGR